jgi:hypothetical protein
MRECWQAGTRGTNSTSHHVLVDSHGTRLALTSVRTWHTYGCRLGPAHAVIGSTCFPGFPGLCCSRTAAADEFAVSGSAFAVIGGHAGAAVQRLHAERVVRLPLAAVMAEAQVHSFLHCKFRNASSCVPRQAGLGSEAIPRSRARLSPPGPLGAPAEGFVIVASSWPHRGQWMACIGLIWAMRTARRRCSNSRARAVRRRCRVMTSWQPVVCVLLGSLPSELQPVIQRSAAVSVRRGRPTLAHDDGRALWRLRSRRRC